MASSFVSSSLTCEDEGKNHLYQLLREPGPRGAYEARQADGGFYVRVDMPGVPSDGVKVVKRGETRTVTFTGKAPERWDCDTSERVYGGYVVLDRNPCEIEVEVSVVNGCLRLFFPAADGVLHSLNSRPRNSTPGSDAFQAFPPAAHLFNGQIPVFPTAVHSHINPFLLSGVEGVYEIKTVDNKISGETYLRVDMPGIGEENYMLEMDGNRLIHGGQGSKEHRLDKGGREYAGGMACMCECCNVSGPGMVQMMDGVLRILFSQAQFRQPNPQRRCFMTMFCVMKD